MLKEIWKRLLKWIGVLKNLVSKPSSAPGGESVPAGHPALPTRKLYETKAFSVTNEHINKASIYLFKGEGSKRMGPTPAQQKVVFNEAAAISILAGAGSGKSTTLVSRLLFMRKVLGIPFANMAVFTFTRKSRADFVKKLVKDAQHWQVPLSTKEAEKIVRTFHSKALQVASSTLPEDALIFEFLGKKKKNFTPHKKSHDEEYFTAPLSDAEEEANNIEGFVELKESPEQAEILKEVYAHCYQTSDTFRQAIATLYEQSFRSPVHMKDEKYNEKASHLDKMERKDIFLCEHLESRWKEQGSWPIDGVQTLQSDGSRYPLMVGDHKLHANGYVPSLNLYVVLGRYDGITKNEISKGKCKISPSYAVNDKKIVLLAGCDKPIRYIKSKQDAAHFRRQLELASIGTLLSAPAVELILPGEKSSPAFSCLYAFGMFTENLGLNPANLSANLSSYTLSISEKAAIEAVSIFYTEFYSTLKRKNMVSFNQIFAMLGKNSDTLRQVGLPALMGVKHLMIDEFQDISPLVVNFVLGMHTELEQKSGHTQQPSLMCVGDDWQSIYGWRGSSPHFLLTNFAQDFPGSEKEPMLMQENFRSSQLIIDCGESFINQVQNRSHKKGIASRLAVKDLPYSIIAVEDYKLSDIQKGLCSILELAGENEEVYLLARTKEDVKLFEDIQDPRFTVTTFHQSKGLEADYVVLFGAPVAFGTNNLKNSLYRAANFPQSFDEAQRDEAFRVAYVAATRAKKFCIWYGTPQSSNVLELVPADGRTRQVMTAETAISHIRKILPSLTDPAEVTA
ncbi:UvrD-helicase domain-containing protein [Chitinolyticbacter meiyuanensis]|uniref:UvrD-helicase domain-containing protein n=1 Tax=Chitinolyticbacter meiyuanensis TaxID=682798 RepID=UPI0011E5BCDD|nr:UvrD-helicase domain-containing protein [Chitinolyticbacter meiyuanensis]